MNLSPKATLCLAAVLVLVPLGLLFFWYLPWRGNGGADAGEVGRSAIEQLHRKDWAASRSQDFETLLSLWTEDGVLFPPGRNPVVGKDALRAFFQEQKPELESVRILEYSHDFQEVMVMGDWAFEWGVFHGSAQSIEGGPVVQDSSRIFRVLSRQEDGSWKVARAVWQPLSG